MLLMMGEIDDRCLAIELAELCPAQRRTPHTSAGRSRHGNPPAAIALSRDAFVTPMRGLL